MDATFLSHPFISVLNSSFSPSGSSFLALLTDNGSITGRNEISETIFSKDIISFFLFCFLEVDIVIGGYSDTKFCMPFNFAREIGRNLK